MTDDLYHLAETAPHVLVARIKRLVEAADYASVAWAAEILGTHAPAEEYVAAFLIDLCKGAPAFVRERVAYALAHQDTSATRVFLAEALHDSDGGVREAASRALRFLEVD
jgi:HEAT repeat protein